LTVTTVITCNTTRLHCKNKVLTATEQLCMEACFCHRIKNKKGNCDFLSHNSDFFFLTIASLGYIS